MRQIVEVENERACRVAEQLVLMFHVFEAFRQHSADEKKTEAMRRLCARQAAMLRRVLGEHLEAHGLAPREGVIEVWCRGLEVVLGPKEDGRLALLRLSLCAA